MFFLQTLARKAAETPHTARKRHHGWVLFFIFFFAGIAAGIYIGVTQPGNIRSAFFVFGIFILIGVIVRAAHNHEMAVKRLSAGDNNANEKSRYKNIAHREKSANRVSNFFVCLITATVLYVATDYLYTRSIAANWPQTEATSQGVKTTQELLQKNKTVTITLHYEVDGHKRQTNIDAPWRTVFQTSKSVADLEKKYAKDTKHMIYYDPHNPTKILLYRFDLWIILLCISLPICLFFLFNSVKNFTNSFKADSTDTYKDTLISE